MPSTHELIQLAADGERVVILSSYQEWRESFLKTMWGDARREFKMYQDSEFRFASGGSLRHCIDRRTLRGLTVDRIAVIDMELDEETIIDLKYRCRKLHRLPIRNCPRNQNQSPTNKETSHETDPRGILQA